MKLSEFNYELPKELIAQEGLARRDASRLMALRKDAPREHLSMKDLPRFFKKGDLLILNNTRVAKARLMGKKSTGGKVDCLVLPSVEPPLNGKREVFLRGSNILPGANLEFSNGTHTVRAKVIEKLEGAKYRVEFDAPEHMEAVGELPLPPYIKKKMEEQERYQTIYSKTQGSLAAPTAGLHFTPELFSQLKSIGVELAYVTLHIGIGTFQPIRTETVEDWKMHPEHYNVSDETASTINAAIQAQRRCFAVGTTSVRTLETCTKNGRVNAGEGWTDIFIYPGYRFQFPYAGLLTNFHLPESTLLLLVSALAGKERIFEAYREAVEMKYRFFSLGDGMLIEL